MAVSRAKARFPICASLRREPTMFLCCPASRPKLRQTFPIHHTGASTVRLHATNAPTMYRKCRDIASILDSPQNTDPSPRPVEIIAHVRTVRAQKRRAFAALADGSTVRQLQVLLAPDQAIGYVFSNSERHARKRSSAPRTLTLE